MPLTQEQRQAMYASIDKEKELKANQNTSYGGDLVDAFQMGALNAAGGVANFINEDFAEKNFFEPAREQVLEMTDESQRAMQADSLAGMGARGVGLHLSSGVGQMAATLPMGLGAGKAISTIGRLKAGTTATQMGGLGLSGGASAQGQTAHGVKEQVLNTDFETLANSPVYKELFLSIDNNPEFANSSDAIKLDLARKQLADKASYEAEIDPAMWAANIGLSAIGDSSVLGVLGKTTRGARSVLPNAAKGFAVEGSTESLQGGAEHYRSNAILRDNADPSINPNEGLGNAMLTEGVIGGLTGGLIKGTYGSLTGEYHKPKASEGDQIDLTNPSVGNEDGTVDDATVESPELSPELNQESGALSADQITRINQTTAPNYDVPAYARQNGVESPMQYGGLGDDLINNNIRPSNVPAVIPKQTDLQTIPGETSTGYNVAPYLYEGELIQPEPIRSRQQNGLLGKGQIIDDAEYYEQRGLPDKHTGVIYGQDNRPMQQAQENADKLKRAPLALTDKNVIFTADERKWRGMSSGHPFRSERALKLSAPYKAAVKSGAQIDIQKTKGGYVWSTIDTIAPDTKGNIELAQSGDIEQVRDGNNVPSVREPEQATPDIQLPEGSGANSTESLPVGSEPQANGSAIEDSKIAVNDTVSNVDVIQTPVNELSLSSDIPQFKSGSDSDGVVEPLTGKFDPVGMSPIQVWVRKDGRKEIITGRHRFDLAKRSGISNIPAQYHFESKGFTADDGKRLDAILNIREDKGQVEDYVELFKQDGITESEAKQYGLLDRATGRTAYKIANSAVNETIEAQRSGRISSQAAEAIADAAPNNEKLQVLGIKAIADDQRSIAFAKNLIHAVSAISKTNSQQADNGDLFGFDDSAMREAEYMAKVAAKKQRELRTRLNSIRGAAKNPKLAKEEGVDVKDPQSLIKRTQALSDEAKAWDSWHTNPNLVSQIKSEINGEPSEANFGAETDVGSTENIAQTNSFFENENQSSMFEDNAKQSTEPVDNTVDKPDKASKNNNDNKPPKGGFSLSGIEPKTKTSKLDTVEQKLNDELSDLFGELKAAFKEQKGTFNSGIDPKIAFIVSKIGAVLAAKGVVKFAQWANKLVKLAMQNGIPKDDIKPYLKSSYGAIANDPDRYGVSDDVADSMDSPREVRAADVDAILEENAKPEQEPQSDSRTVDETKRSDVIGGNEATDRKITSLSYERSKKRTEKNVEGFISGNGQGGYIKEPLTYKKTPYSTHERLLENKLTKDEFEAAIVEIKEDKDVILDKIKLELKGGGALAIAYRDFVNDSSWGRKTNSQKAAIAYSKMVSDIERITQQSDTTPVKQPSSNNQAKPTPKPNLATKFKAGDLSSVKQSLPMLTDKQADDMVKIENRFNGLNGVKKGRGFLLTNGTGTGKTFNGLAAIARAKQQGKKNILILSLSDGISNQWIKTGKDHFDLDIYKIGDESPTNRGDRGKEITIASYVTFGDSKPLVTERDWDLIIADESQTLMQGAQAIPSKALKSLRSVIGHSEFDHKAYLFFADEQAKINDLYQSLNKTYLSAGLSVEDASAKAQSETQTEQDKLNTKIREKAEQFKKEAKAKPNDNTNVLMLSASPFAYVKNLDYAEGLLFNYSDYGPEFEGGYENAGHGHNAFYIQNFGYRWRYHRLTTPSGKIDNGLMERNFYENMKKQGVLSGRFIEIDNDFGRNFYIVESAAGKKLDDAISTINDSKNDKDESLYPNLSTALRNLFDFTEQVKFTEAIKAPETVKVAKQMIEQGKKVIIFHSYNVGGSSNPLSRLYSNSNPEVQNELSILERANRGILDINFGGLERPLDVFQDAFGDSVVFYNGKVPAKQRIANKDAFNEKGGKVKVIVVQQDAGSAGLSLHDVHGDEPRVLINMGLPFKPVQSIQIEGRPVRVGVKSDTAIVYMTTGTRFEEYAFASKIATRADTADNLALGDEARGIKDSFIDGYSELIDNPDAIQFDGAKAMAERQKLSPFDKAKAYYYGVLKNNKRRDQREGVDYFATPEPLGLKMVEWLQAAPGDRLLEPSGGHGAIARFFPSDTINKAIEDSPNLINKLQLVFNGNAKKGDFLKMPLINKFEGIVMNPPYGVGGKTAMEHLSKAVKHLAFGGRIVALIPHGGNASKNFDKFLDEHEKQIQLTKSITMPRSTFENAGTSVSSKVVVLDKLEKGHDVIQHEETNLRYDYSIDEFFNRIENMDLPDRDRPEKPEIDFKRYSVVRNKKFSTEVSIKKSFHDFASENREGIMDIAREYDGFNEERSDGYTFSFKNEDSAEDFANEIAAMIHDSGIKYRDLIPDVASVPNGTFKASRENPDLVGYTMDSKHTKTDDDLFVVNFEGDMGDEYSDINSIAKDNGGYYIKAALRRFYTPKDGGEKQGTPTYTFKSKDDRDAFISALSMRSADAESLAFNKAKDAPPKGISHRAAKLALHKFMKEYQGAGNTKVVIADKDQADVLGAEYSIDKIGYVKGAYGRDTDTLYIFPQNHRSMDDLRATLQEEILVHKGIMGLPPIHQQALLLAIMDTRKSPKKSIKEAWARIDRLYGHESEVDKAEEFLAKISHDKMNLLDRYYQKLLSAVHKIMVKLGLTRAEMSRADMRLMVYKMSESLKTKRDNNNSKPNGKSLKFNLADSAEPSPLSSNLKDVKSWLGSKWSESLGKRLAFITNNQIKDIYSPLFNTDSNNPLTDYLSEVEKMDAEQVSRMQEAEVIVEKYLDTFADKAGKRSDVLGKLMMQATRLGIFPERHLEDQPSYTKLEKKLSRIEKGDARYLSKHEKSLGREEGLIAAKARVEAELDDISKAYDEARSMYVLLGKSGQEAYHKVESYYQDMWRDTKQSMLDRINDTDIEQSAKKKLIQLISHDFEKSLKGRPYFPLSRFGEYIVTATDKEGDYIREHFESLKEAKDAIAEYKEMGLTAKLDKLEPYTNGNSQDVIKLARELSSKLKTKQGSDQAKIEGLNADMDIEQVLSQLDGIGVEDTFIDAIYQTMLSALPQQSAAKRSLHRRNVKGSSSDYRRIFNDTALHQAKRIAKLKHTHKMDAQLKSLDQAVRSESDNDLALVKREVSNEMKKRHEMLLNPNTPPWVGMVGNLSFMFYLGFSPAAGMINMTQTYLVALPQLAAKYGFFKASKELLRASKEFFKGEANFDFKKPLTSLSQTDAWQTVLNQLKDKSEIAAIKALHDDGTINLTQAHALQQAAETDTAKNSIHHRRWIKFSRGVGAFFHNAEIYNREVTALTAYRLAKDANPKATQAELIEIAKKAVVDGHFDYSTANRARFMRYPATKLMFIFKQHVQNMMYTLIRNGFKAAKGDKEAQKVLAYIVGMHFMAAGALGLPFAEELLLLASAIMEDEDEPKDYRYDLRNSLDDSLGKFGGQAASTGLVNALLGVDLSSRVSLSSMLGLPPDEHASVDDKFNHYLMGAIGVSGSLLKNSFKGGQLILEGVGEDWDIDKMSKGFETLAPKMIKDPMKAYRRATSGEQTRSLNDVVAKDEFDQFDILMTSIGFTPSKLSDRYDARNAIKDKEGALLKRKRDLLNRYYKAWKNGDNATRVMVMKEMINYSKANPNLRFTSKSIEASMKARLRAANQTQKGVYLGKNSEYLRAAGSFSD